MRQFHPAESHREILREGPDGLGRDWVAESGWQLQAGGDTQLPRHGGCGQQPGQGKSAGRVHRLRSRPQRVTETETAGEERGLACEFGGAEGITGTDRISLRLFLPQNNVTAGPPSS